MDSLKQSTSNNIDSSHQIMPPPSKKAEIIEGGFIRFNDKTYSISYFPAGSIAQAELTGDQLHKAAEEFVKLLNHMGDDLKNADGLTLTKNNIIHGGEGKKLDHAQQKIAQSIFSQFEELDPSEEQFTLKEEPSRLEKELKLDFEEPIVKKEETQSKELKQEAPNSGAVASKYLKMARDYANDKLLPEGVEEIKISGPDFFGKTKIEIKLTNNQSVLINQFTPDAYRGPQHGDFQDRLQKMYDSIHGQIIQESSNPRKNQMFSVLSQKFDQALTRLKSCEKEHFNIDVRTEEGLKNFDKSLKYCEHELAQFIQDASFLLSKVSGQKITSKEIANAEKNYIINNPRPTVINTYQIANPKDHRDIRTFISMQQPRSKNGATLPSTARNQVGLGNYVLTSHGVVQPSGDIKITYEGIRHTSYPPISIKDDKERQKGTIENVKQEVEDLAGDLIEKNGSVETSKEKPLIVNLRTMILLTAKSVDFVRNKQFGVFGKWTGQGESLMLEDSYRAMMEVNGKPFKVKINDRDYWIKPDIKVMNLGVNTAATSDKGGLIGKLPNGKIQDEVNNKGFTDFANETYSYINKELQKLDLPPFRISEYKELAAKLRNEGQIKLADLVSVTGDAIALYRSGDHLKAEHITDFQTCFLLAHHLMGNPSTFFCKSGEDRTGNQNNRIEEYLVYKEFYPEGHVTDRGASHKGISSKVHMFSASQDNTYFNSFARGLQVGGAVNKDYEHLAEAGKKMGCLAKEPFALAKEMKPSYDALKLAEDLKL